jgi:hypothetical protein
MCKGQWTESLKGRDRWRDVAIEGIIMILVNKQLDALFQCIYLFISLLYMFRATQCSSSGESIVSINTRLCIDTTDSPDVEHWVARNT